MPRTPRSSRELAAGWVPFGLDRVKPRHYRGMARVAWENRDNLSYAWKVLSRGVCDGCALGTSGLRDWTIDGTHLCMVRLELLRLNTMGAMPTDALADLGALAGHDSKALRGLGRLAHPLRRRRGERGFTRVSFDEVWEEVGRRWSALDPARTAMYLTSRGITNEVYYAAQKVMRLLGSNNVDNSARLCHSPSTAGLKRTLGVAATTCSYRDWFDSDLIVFFGSNPANDQPVATKYLIEARRRGTRVLMVNPYREPGMERYWVPSNFMSSVFGTRLTDRFYPVSVGGDLAFLNAVQKVLIARGWVKHDFVEAATSGYDELAAELEAQPMDGLLARCGLRLAEVEDFARELAAADTGVFVWSMGITQHAHGSDTVAALVNLGLLREFVGRPGTGMMPIRGHSGVQGGAEMGAYATAFPGGAPIDADSAARLSERWGFPVPDRPGLTTVEALDAAGRGELDSLWCVGGNFLETLPAPDAVAAALGRIPLRVHTDIVPTTQMFVEPADTVFVLPSRTRYEQRGGGTETTTERRVIFSPRIEGHDVGEATSEWELLLGLARAARPDLAERLGFTDGASIRADIAATIEAYAPIAGLRRQGDQFQWGGPRLCEGRRFPTSDGRAHFAVVRPPDSAVPGDGAPDDDMADAGGRAPGAGRAPLRLRLATRRGKQFNSMIQAERDPLNGADRDHVLISAADTARLGLRDGDAVVLAGAAGRMAARLRVAPVAEGTLQAHWPEANVLVPAGHADPGGGVPDYNATVTVERATGPAAR